MRPILIAVFLAFAPTSTTLAQSWSVLPGTGCQQLPWTPPAPAVSGPLTTGSTISLGSLGMCTPYHNWAHDSVGPAFVFLGLPLSQMAWIDLRLWIADAWRRCPWSVHPIISILRAPVGPGGNYSPLQLPVPNDPSLVGTTLAVQTSCWAWIEVYSMSPGALVSRAVEITIG